MLPKCYQNDAGGITDDEAPLHQKLTKQSVAALQPAEAEYVCWDTELPGFGVRVLPSGRKTYIVQYRVGGGRSGQPRKPKIGVADLMSAEDARKRARGFLHAASVGQDPASERLAARQDLTVAELAERWLNEGALRDRRTGKLRKPANVKGEAGRIDAHIVPLLGSRRLGTLTRADIEAFRDQIMRGATKGSRKTRKHGVARVRGGDGTATRTVRLLSSIFAWASDHDLIKENPAASVKLPPARRMTRFLSSDELGRLGAAIRRAREEGLSATALFIIELLALTGARRGEIEQLRWAEVDTHAGLLRLIDSKTGQKEVPLSPAAVELLMRVPRLSSEWVFPASSGKGHFQGTAKVWHKLATWALFDQPTRIHDLRHTFASVGASEGHGLSLIGAVLGHRATTTTARYAHAADTRLKEVTASISHSIGIAMAEPVRPSAANEDDRPAAQDIPATS